MQRGDGPGPVSAEALPSQPVAPAISGTDSISREATKPEKEEASARADCDRDKDLDESTFECNICLELAKEPVVTLCGHLYCWPCLFRWIQVQNYVHQCPVCKAGVDVDKVIPIYGRGCDADPRSESVKVLPVPARPAGQRPAPVQAPQPIHGMPQPQQQGVLPGLFNFGLGPGQGYAEALTPEQQHQAFLSRLLLMLGSFVIMCLLLF